MQKAVQRGEEKKQEKKLSLNNCGEEKSKVNQLDEWNKKENKTKTTTKQKKKKLVTNN